LTGQICNDGPGAYAYAAVPLHAYFEVIIWHPPKTPAMEGNIKWYGDTNLGTAMNAHECRSFRHQLPIANFSRWGQFPPSATERQAWVEFTAKVDRGSGPGFTACEDTNNINTHASSAFPYMEKIN
jgi:hypothetical protein